MATSNPPPGQSETRPKLFYISLNDDAKSTIIFMHGLMSSHLEYSLVVPYLKDYHLLLVDLPAHAGSIDIKPFSLSLAAELVADLIREHAHGGRAHVVGLSMGGFTALELGKSHPEVVQSLWVTGAAPFEGWFIWMAQHSGFVYHTINVLVNWIPTWANLKISAWSGLQVPPELVDAQRKNLARDTVRDVYTSILNMTSEEIEKISVRTLTVAGGRQDQFDATTKMGQVLKVQNPASKAVVVKDAMHAWNLQFPELFAKGVRAWIEEAPLPAEFVGL
ncbi:hypothetical protein B0A52_07089 [Exophiala mesophila]|uniref:AB hydrolase-1 domain-containing protein n=1 Tax=Exophiala mesophila TaxID=212818 RepID=A0A438MY40_EXOME|nr:hypothetical protein B0A52_07089 [Exophiala mesophila]